LLTTTSYRRFAITAVSGVLISMLAASTPLGAQGFGSDGHIIRVGFGGGVTVPISDAGDAFKSGVNGQGFVLVQLPGLPALRFALSYDRLSLKPTLANPAAAGEDEAGHSQILGGIAGIKIHILPGPVRPYLMAGVGAFNVNDLVNLSSGTASTSSTNFGFDGGAGIEIKLGRLAAFAEGRLQNVYTRNNGLIAKNSITSVPVTFGLLF
jgi:opacity protein-like surface antigen